MEEYTTFQVEKFFKIKRTRLQEWIDVKYEYVVPMQKAKGKGDRTLFSIDDLYRLSLFIYLIRHGSSRFEAAEYSKLIDFNDVGEGPGQIKYAYKLEKMETGALRSSGSWGAVAEHPKIENNEQVNLLVINLVGIKHQVDTLIKS